MLHISLTDFEANFIRLLDKITNGSRIEINQTGKFISHLFSAITAHRVVESSRGPSCLEKLHGELEGEGNRNM